MHALRFIIIFFLALGISWVGTLIIRSLATQLGLLDRPTEPRKIHTHPIPLFGGFAIYCAVTAVVLIAWLSGWLADPRVPTSVLVGIFCGGAVLMLGGFLDDKFSLSWKVQIIFTLAAVFIVLISGLTMPFVSNPIGAGLLRLDTLQLNLIPVGMAQLVLSLAEVFLFVWIVGMMYTTKLLDGIDGLASSISCIGAFIIFVVSLFWDKSGSTTSYIAIALVGALLGFLFWNWHPAKIFLGDGGSTYLGFMLAVLAVLSGGKIATALLVMGVPIMDVLWIIVRRLLTGKRIFSGDDKHLHFRLLQAGLTQQQVVLVLSVVALAFGSLSFFFQTRVKVIALIILVIVMLMFASFLVRRNAKKTSTIA